MSPIGGAARRLCSPSASCLAFARSCGYCLQSAHFEVDKRLVSAGLADERRGRVVLDDFAILNDDDAIEAAKRREAVCNRDYRSSAHQLRQRFPDEILGMGIKCRRGFIEQ